MASLAEFGTVADIRISFALTSTIREAAYAMALYFEPPILLEFDPQCSICDHRKGAVVELGAGNGFLGLKLARMLSLRQGECAHALRTLVLTDLDAVCPLLERNCVNKFTTTADLPSVNLVVQSLEWGNLNHGLRLADRLTYGDSPGRFDPSDPLLSHIVCSDLVSMFHIIFLPAI